MAPDRRSGIHYSMKLHTRHLVVALVLGVVLLIIASLATGWPPSLGKLLGGVSGLITPIGARDRPGATGPGISVAR
jgi:hypothetical protein